MIIITNLAMTYGPRLLFEDVTCVLREPSRYGLVGANGSGKSTFLRLLAGQEEPTEGTIFFPKKARIGWLKQDQFRYDNELVLNVVLQGNSALWNALSEKEALLKKDPQAGGYKLAELEDIIACNDGYSAESTATQLLIGLGITESQQYNPLHELSGGFKLRVLLAQALFNNPDILILDEPNNYLDIITIAWLENYLKRSFKGLLIFTSHDYDFLNNVATTILDIDYGEIREYPGNYTSFEKQKKAILEQKIHERTYQERKITRLKTFVERFRASASRSRQALSREKMIEKIELPDIENTSRRAPKFHFTCQRPVRKRSASRVKNY